MIDRSRKITQEIADSIRKEFASNRHATSHTFASRYGISLAQVKAILSGTTWNPARTGRKPRERK